MNTNFTIIQPSITQTDKNQTIKGIETTRSLRTAGNQIKQVNKLQCQSLHITFKETRCFQVEKVALKGKPIQGRALVRVFIVIMGKAQNKRL